jgi:HAD superfamily hydrolase (TIGR01484 family)
VRPGANRELNELSAQALAGVTCVLADIDDTITTEGTLTAEAYRAVEELGAAGYAVVPVTGRPAGWCDHIARFWPVAGVVGENGAFYFRYDRAARKMRAFHALGEAERLRHRKQLDVLAGVILAEVPGCALASDQSYRVADLAIDFCEDVPPLAPAQVDQILSIFQSAGATAKVSSIHVNGWFGHYDKLSMSREFLARELGVDAIRQPASVVYVGDSPNDEPMFAAFPLSVGVANVRRFADRMRHMPSFVTPSESGRGFVELARRLIEARAA